MEVPELKRRNPLAALTVLINRGGSTIAWMWAA